MKIIGQDQLIKEVNTIIEIFVNSNCEIRPHFILVGPSGSGKTLTIRHLAEKHNCNFLEINGAQLTKEGTSGNSLSKSLAPLLHLSNLPTLVFVDEFDKLFISGNSNSDLAHEATNGVQNEFLNVIEGTTTSIFGDYGKYISIKTSNLLFIFSGAFNGEEDINLDRLREYGIKTEFLGRVGLVYKTTSLSIEDMYKIIEENELLDKYIELFSDADKEKIILEIKAYIRDNHKFNTIGARLINTLINQYFIKGGLLKEQVKKITFQNKMTLK